MEDLYQYLWKYKGFGTEFKDEEDVISILSPGRLNTDAGPDFSSAVVKINGQQWAGNIEIHAKASDWYRHGHDDDPAYNNVILHVVGVNDVRIRRRDGSVIPQITVNIPDGTLRTAAELKSGLSGVRCASYIAALPPLAVHDWVETLAVERLQMKSRRIYGYLEMTGGDWERSAFITLSRALGFGVNSEPFEMLGRMLPLNYMRRHADNPVQLEAMIFGVAGVLKPHLHPYDEYYQLLVREYQFLAAKYGLRAMDDGVWKFSRMRPHSQPYRRMALLAAAVASGESLIDIVIDYVNGKKELKDMFAWHVSDYWMTHYGFGSSSSRLGESPGKTARELLMINVVAPFAYLYCSRQGDPEGCERAMSVLERLPAERNAIVEMWKSLGVASDNAFRSQALIHLRREYCDRNKCLQCRFGHKMLRRSLSAE